MGIERTIISHPDQFAERLFPSLAQTIAYIAEKVARAISNLAPRSRAESGRSTYLRTLTAHFHPFSPNGLNSKQIYDSATLADVLPSRFVTRFMLVEPVNGRLTITDVGSGFEIFGETWQENARGLPMEEQPDYDYGRWVQGIYRRVMETRLPRLDEVDATIRRPHRNDRVHLRYRRLDLAVHVQRTRRDMPSWRIGC